MPEFRRDLYLVQEFLLAGAIGYFRNLQRDAGLVDRVIGPVHVRQRPRRDATEDPVLADLLARSQHVSCPA